MNSDSGGQELLAPYGGGGSVSGFGGGPAAVNSGRTRCGDGRREQFGGGGVEGGYAVRGGWDVGPLRKMCSGGKIWSGLCETTPAGVAVAGILSLP